MITLRGYREGDLEAMFALDEVCFATPFRFSRSAMKRFAEAKKALVAVAVINEELVGFCLVHVERGGLGYVVTLDVSPAVRRRGVARALMLRLEAEALAAGCNVMGLHVFAGNTEAIRFYERMDYSLVGEAADFYGEGMPALVYRKALVSKAS